MARPAKWPINEADAERRVVLIVVIVFLVTGSAWILFSDLLLYSVVKDRAVAARLETAKGEAFVALAALLLYAVTLRGMRQLARARRTISAVVECMGDGVLLLGSDRTIAYANPASIDMLRVANLDDLRGMDAAEFSRRFHVSYPDGRLVPPDQLVSQRVFDEVGPIRYKAILYPPGAPEVVISCTATGVRAEIGARPDIVVSVMHDITATEHLERLRDELFTAAAHAIKTPVAVIKGAAQILSAIAPSDVLQSTAMIDRQCARIDQVVENLLVLSRIHSDTLRLYPSELDLGPLVEQVAGEIGGRFEGHAIHVRLDANPRVRVDRERMVMVLRNAVQGGIRSSRPGGPVQIRLERSGADAEVAISYERDPAIGAVHDAHGAVTTFDDLGVGRYVTTTIVEAHGGTLTEQTDGDITQIRIRFPASP